MAEEFLTAGMSVIFDMNVAKASQRRMLKNLAIKNGAVPLTVWIQIDQDTAYVRSSARDRRKTDDKYSLQLDENNFKHLVSVMQKPTNNENYAVISGKHLFNMQQSAVVRKLKDLGVIKTDQENDKIIKPEW
jgi:predicted kinase